MSGFARATDVCEFHVFIWRAGHVTYEEGYASMPAIFPIGYYLQYRPERIKDSEGIWWPGYRGDPYNDTD